ncbi:MAG: YihY/virulence factor BrkB family protein [Bacteroides sp.]|nr:YihY/virulence factor BrkB family protein [Bacteroides sp.]
MADWKVKYDRLVERALAIWKYWSESVWLDTRKNFKVAAVKTINLSVRSFLSTDLQSQACALTYRTVLALVPALAMVLAIFRGFGYSDALTGQLYKLFPSQHQAIAVGIKFVDGYLEQASGGVFVGVGILFLLWTLISLLGSVEDSFNVIWRVRQGRTFWRKITDYLAIFLILPVLMICAGGLSLMMTTTINKLVFINFMATALKVLIDIGSYVMTWLFFAGAYMLIPNAKVKFLNAFLAGVVVGTSFQVIQWLFLTGQMYVTKYNAIYGSFSFVPLLLIWLQLSWLVTMIGALLCYASQNVGQFNYYQDVAKISEDYKLKVTLAVLAIIVKRFVRGMPALTTTQISDIYGIPSDLVRQVVLRLNNLGLIAMEESEGELSEHPLLPGIDVSQLSVEKVISCLRENGSHDFIPGFSDRFPGAIAVVDKITDAMLKTGSDITVSSINIKV